MAVGLLSGEGETDGDGVFSTSVRIEHEHSNNTHRTIIVKKLLFI